MNYSFDWYKNNVLVTLRGDVTLEVMNAIDGILFGDERFDDMDYAIYDFSGVDKFEVTSRDLKVGAAMNLSASRWKHRHRLACVVKDESIMATVKKFIELMKNSTWEIRLFTSLEDAFDWV